ncbi:MAG: hypothetical protein VST72_08990 [Nitrospirota bacterium]|nr:hypothetical protein [Nitrospirota bacterium]
MKRHHALLFFNLLSVFLISGIASAFDITGLQPIAPNGIFSTFSAESIPKNKLAFETGIEISGEPDFNRFYLKGAYGISDSLEFLIMAPYITNFLDQYDGMEDISLGFKHRFYDGGRYGPDLAYLVNASIPSGGDEFSTDGRFGLGLILTKRIGPFKGHMNLFYEKPGTGRLNDEVSFLGGIEFSAAHNFKLLSEILAKKSHYSREYNQVEARFGYRIKTTDYIHTTIGIGFDLKNRSPEYRIMLSVSFVPPGKAKQIRKVYEKE